MYENSPFLPVLISLNFYKSLFINNLNGGCGGSACRPTGTKIEVSPRHRVMINREWITWFEKLIQMILELKRVEIPLTLHWLVSRTPIQWERDNQCWKSILNSVCIHDIDSMSISTS